MRQDEIREAALDLLKQREPTVQDARRLARQGLQQSFTLRFRDGYNESAEVRVQVVDILHSPDMGYALKVRPLERSLALSRGRAHVVPLRLLVEIPDPFAFLALPASEWPFPAAILSCERCGQEVLGRFCPACGTKARGNSHPGPSFSAEQIVLRELGAPVHDCGAAHLPQWKHCSKCGREISS